MTDPLDTLLGFAADDSLAARLADALGAQPVDVEHRKFPDGESYFRVVRPTLPGRVAILTDLSDPDSKFLPLALLADTLRDLGWGPVGLIAPYLPYMRQDRRFRDGEGVTSRYFAAMISQHFDWLVTVDPHLHRYHDLGEIYRIPTQVAHAAPAIAGWISDEVARPVLIGPDHESEQWVGAVAEQVDAPFAILKKTRHGDRNVEVNLPRIERWRDRTPVLVDDIVSSGRTMLEVVGRLSDLGLPPAVCVGVHALFAGESYQQLLRTGTRVVTVNTVPHPSNAIDIAQPLAHAVTALKAG